MSITWHWTVRPITIVQDRDKDSSRKTKKEVQVVLTLLKASRKKLFVRNNQLDSEGCGECEDLIGGESLRRHHWPALLETPPSPQC